MKPILSALLLLIMANAFSAKIQKTPKSGKISMEEMSSYAVCPIDTAAAAYYIFEKGSTDFVYRQTTIRSDDTGSDKGFQMTFRYHSRLKILNKVASGMADIELRLYKNGLDVEKLSNIKGYTYNLENGKIVSTRLDTKTVIYEEKNDNSTIVKIAMPEVKEGSVVEIEYEIISDFLFNLQEWYFQKQVPVLYSEYKVAIPEYFHYKPSIFGYTRVHQEVTENPKSIRFTYIQKAEGFDVKDYKYEHEERYKEQVTTLYAENISAFKSESFLKAPKNYLTRVSYELVGTKFPQSGYKSFSTRWVDVSKRLLDHESFGRALNRSNFLSGEAQSIKHSSSDTKDIISNAFELVKSKMRWNGINSIFTESNLKQAWESGTGNSAEVNLMLVALLKSAGLNAFPVVLSTQANGMLPIMRPSLSELNYVIAMVQDEKNSYMMDATEPLSCINMLPERCLNGKGFVIDPVRFGETSLEPLYGHYSSLMGDFKMNGTGVFDGTLTMTDAGYAGMYRRKEYNADNNREMFIESLEKRYPGITIQNMEISNLEDVNSDFINSMEIELAGYTDGIGDMILFSPLLAFKAGEHPLKLENREYPIEFSYPTRKAAIFSIEIPEGYYVESIPEPIRVALEDKSITFTYSIVVIDRQIQVFSDFRIERLLFLPDDYQGIKDAFTFMIDKHAEKVVLKRSEWSRPY